MIKLKSYTIITAYSGEIIVSETRDQEDISLTITVPNDGKILLDHAAWNELCGLKYDLKCEKPAGDVAWDDPALDSEPEPEQPSETAGQELQRLTEDLKNDD